MNPPPDPARVAGHWPVLGNVRGIEPLTGDLVSSQLFKVTADSGEYCLKIPGYRRKADQSDDEEREAWDLIHDLREALLTEGVPLERTVPNRDGEILDVVDGRPAWITRFEPSVAFDGSPRQLEAAGRALGNFHRCGMQVLRDHGDWIPRIRKRLYRDLPLSASLAGFGELKSALLSPSLFADYPHLKPYRDQLAPLIEAVEPELIPLCEWAAAQRDTEASALTGLAHNDFHPANLLFKPDGSTVILDLEQMMISPLVRCLGLGVTRFSLAAESKGRDLEDSARSFWQGYLSAHALPAEQVRQLPDWIRLQELEKILRITRRALDGEVYPAMLTKLTTHHLRLCREAEKFRTAPVEDF